MKFAYILVAILLSVAFKADAGLLGNAANALADTTGNNALLTALDPAIQLIMELENTNVEINATIDCINGVLKSMGQSAVEEINQLKDKSNVILYNIETAVQNAIATIGGLVSEFNECTNILCKVGVISRVGSNVETIMNNMKKVLDETQQFLNEAIPSIARSIGEISVKAGQDARQCLN